VRISAKSEYAVRATVGLALIGRTARAEDIATAQGIPPKFLEKILHDLRRAGLVESRRGPEGGHRLAKEAEEITIADVIRAVDGPLAEVRGAAPESLRYDEDMAPLQQVWIAVRASLRSVLETVTIDDVVQRRLPDGLDRLVQEPDAWKRR
jgi:Rrf2 family protein